MTRRTLMLTLLAASFSLSACQSAPAPLNAPQPSVVQHAFTADSARQLSDFSFDAGSTDGATLAFGLTNHFAGRAPGDRQVLAFKNQVAKYKITLKRKGSNQSHEFVIDVDNYERDWSDSIAKCTIYNLEAGRYTARVKAYDEWDNIISEGGTAGQKFPEEGEYVLKPHEMLGAQEKDERVGLPGFEDLDAINWSDYVPLCLSVKLLEDYAMVPGAGITKNIHAVEKYEKKDLGPQWTHHQSRRAKGEEKLPIVFMDENFDDQSNMALGMGALDALATTPANWLVFSTDGKGEGPAYITSGVDVVTLTGNDPNNGLPLANFMPGMNRTMTVKLSHNQSMDFYFNFNGDLKGLSAPYGANENNPVATRFCLVDPERGPELEAYYSSYTGPEGMDAEYYFMQDEQGTIISVWVEPGSKQLLGITIPSPNGQILTHVQLAPSYRDTGAAPLEPAEPEEDEAEGEGED